VTNNLGVVCAQAGLQVVLIDADLRSPDLHVSFDMANCVGLTQLLIGDVPEVAGALQETEIDGLRLVASGPVPPNPSELLGSRQMESVLDQVSEGADLIILDAPPVLLVSDASVLAARADGVLLVVEAKRTSHETALKACETLETVGANILGVVLTKVKTGRRRYYRYYAYSTETEPTRRFKWKRWRRLQRLRHA
jgi:capsular exopolysaccharide synthesis family protein